jgi:hypothetical protein
LEDAAIWIAAAPIVLALVAYAAALVAGASGGLVRILAQAAAVILASFAGALAGFLIPLAPLAEKFIGTAPWAGILGTLGMIGGMSLAETLMARLDKRR